VVESRIGCVVADRRVNFGATPALCVRMSRMHTLLMTCLLGLDFCVKCFLQSQHWMGAALGCTGAAGCTGRALGCTAGCARSTGSFTASSRPSSASQLELPGFQSFIVHLNSPFQADAPSASSRHLSQSPHCTHCNSTWGHHRKCCTRLHRCRLHRCRLYRCRLHRCRLHRCRLHRNDDRTACGRGEYGT
jgi:hypothetical protein